MEHDAFRIGARFWTATGEWECTDVGTRAIVAVKVGNDTEEVFDEYDVEGCWPTRAERDEDLSP